MGYTIQYSPQTNKKYPVRRKQKWPGSVALLLLVSLLLFGAVKYRTEIFRVLLPGDPDITAEAFRGLVADVQEGSAVEALSAFCREIIENAE